VQWDLSQLNDEGEGVITEILPGTPVTPFLKVDKIAALQQRLHFIDEAAVSQHASRLGMDDHCHMWKHVLHDGTADRRDWMVSLSDHHQGFYAFIGTILDTFSDDVEATYWQAPSPWPPTCPFVFVPANSVIKRKPPAPGTVGLGALKVRRSANLRHPWDVVRAAFHAKFGRRAPLAYNADCQLPAKPTALGAPARRQTAAQKEMAVDKMHPTFGPCGIPPGVPDPPPKTRGGRISGTDVVNERAPSAVRALRRQKTTSSGAAQRLKASRLREASTSPPRVDMLTRHDLGQIIVILW
jgi:hypothetical protein